MSAGPDDTGVPVGPDEPALVAAPADTRAVALRDVIKTYRTPAGSALALAGISLDVDARGLTVVAGRAGAGVSTLLGIIGCLERADSGAVWVAGLDVASATRNARRDHRRRAIGLLSSEPAANLLARRDAADSLSWAAKRRTGATLNSAGVDAHLTLVGLEGAARQRVAEMHRGGRQRLALACALVGEPRLVVADDPTATLDREEANRFVTALRDAADRGTCVLVGTTDPVVLAAADHFVHLVGGQLA